MSIRYKKLISVIISLALMLSSLSTNLSMVQVAKAEGGATEATIHDGLETVTGAGFRQVEDPITSDMISPGVATIDQIYQVETDSSITVIGQVTYLYGNNGTPNTALIQDVIDGEIIGVQIYDKNNITQYVVGDIIEVTGKVGEYGGVRQLSGVSKITSVAKKEAFPPQELTIAQLLQDGEKYISEYITIKNVRLGTYGSNTTIQDSTGTINIYSAASYPEGIKAGDQADIVAAFSKYYETYQLRNGSKADYTLLGNSTPPDEDEVDPSVVMTLASFAGTTLITSPVVYGDLDAPNDGKNTSVCLTHSSGNPPKVTDTSMGYVGNKEGDYYQIQLSTSGYGNINVSYKMRGSNTGPKNFKLLYSLDGVQFTQAGAEVYSIAAASTWQSYTVTLPKEVYKAATLFLRIQVADNVSVNNKTIGSGGTNYIQEVKITGNPLKSSDIAGAPQILPDTDVVTMGQEITMVTATEGAEIYYCVNDGEYTLYQSEDKPIIQSFPYKVTAYARKAGIADSIKVTRTYSQAQVSPVKPSINGGAVRPGTKLNLTTDTDNAIILYSTDGGTTWITYVETEAIVLNTLPVTILAKAVKDGYLDSEAGSFSFTLRVNEKYSIYFGQIHSHTTYSDGAGSCEEAFAYAKNEAEQIDFLAVTDHSNSFDNEDKASILNGSMSEEWMEGHRLANDYTDDTFVGIYGYEMTWSNGLGHMNTYNTAGFQSRNQADFKTYSTALQNYYTVLKTDMNSISQFNHPGKTFGDFDDFGYYDETIDRLISLIEVGNGEGAVRSNGYFPSYEYYTRALDKGWHVAPTNNQDNHKGLWGDANTARTVVLADTLTRENIYDALRNMRTYATEDNDLAIQYTLNGEIMGTIIDTTPSQVDIQVEISDPTDAAIGKVEVIVNGGLSIASKNVEKKEEKVTFQLPASYSYYYIRVTQKDQDIAVTAPVWIGEVEAAGIAGISAENTLPVKGEPIVITTDLYNNEAEDLNIEKMEFSVNETVIHKADLAASGLTKLSFGATGSYTFAYTHPSVGAAEINVTVQASIGGVSKVFQGVLKLDYSDPDRITRIVVDGSHFNDYVTGYYTGNMGNLIEIAAENDTKVTVVKDKITQDTLKDCDLLIISAPAKKSGSDSSGSYSVSHFEEEFISLVKDYTNRGGDVILCGLADYQDTAEGQSSTEINKLLEAIGATTRINSDEAYDEVNNGGQPYRLYLNTYNMDSPFLKGVTTDQNYSAYSGCTVLLNEATVADGKAEYLVKGHSTTYSIDSKTFGGNYQEIQKGDAILLAREELSTGSNIFIAGTVFMSNFEVKATLDNVWDKPYSNRTIIENIMASVKKQIEVRDIAKVRKGIKGNIYCIEGTVTAGTVPGNAFFDTIYIQDESSGINIFPINQSLIEVGQKVRVIGYLDEYLGDLELRVMEATVIDVNMNPVEPRLITTRDSMDYEAFGGMLVKIKGKITNIISKNNQIESIYVMDESGSEARVFMDGYIGYSNDNGDKLEDILGVGKTITAIGLVSCDPEGVRIRVRDRSEIILDESSTTPTPEPTTDPEPSVSPKPTISPEPSVSPEPSITPKPTVAPRPTPGETQSSTSTPTGAITPTPSVKQLMKEVKLPGTEEFLPAMITAVRYHNRMEVEIIIEEDNKVRNAKKQMGMEIPYPISIQFINNELIEHFKKEAIKEAVLSIVIPKDILDNDNLIIETILLEAKLLMAAAEKERDIIIVVKDDAGKERFTWSWYGKDLAKSKREIKDVNLAMTLSRINEVQQFEELLGTDDSKVMTQGYALRFRQMGILPSQARVKIYVGKEVTESGWNNRNIVYLYHRNLVTGKLDTLPYSSNYRITEDGYITITILTGTDYVMLPKPASKKVVSTLRDQIIVKSAAIKLNSTGEGSSYQINLELPDTLVLIGSDTEDTSLGYIGGVSASFSSSDNKVVTVDQRGRVTAVKKGSATITVTLTLYSNKTKIVKVKVKVK